MYGGLVYSYVALGVIPIFILNMRSTVNNIINNDKKDVYIILNTPTYLISASEEEEYVVPNEFFTIILPYCP